MYGFNRTVILTDEMQYLYDTDYTNEQVDFKYIIGMATVFFVTILFCRAWLSLMGKTNSLLNCYTLFPTVLMKTFSIFVLLNLRLTILLLQYKKSEPIKHKLSTPMAYLPILFPDVGRTIHQCSK